MPTMRLKASTTNDAADDFPYYLRLCGADLPAPVRDYRFHPTRKWRLDWAWPQQRVALEVDGGRYAFAGGRHATDADHEKLNRAASMGWRVLHVSPEALRNSPGALIADIRDALAYRKE